MVTTERRIARTVVTPPDPGFLGEGHTAVEVIYSTDLPASDPFVLLMDDRLDIAKRRAIGGAHPHAVRRGLRGRDPRAPPPVPRRRVREHERDREARADRADDHSPGTERTMRFSMAPLLMHSPDVPVGVRDALVAAYAAEPEHRADRLEAAARLLHRETDLACDDVRELIGIPGGC